MATCGYTRWCWETSSLARMGNATRSASTAHERARSTAAGGRRQPVRSIASHTYLQLIHNPSTPHSSYRASREYCGERALDRTGPPPSIVPCAAQQQPLAAAPRRTWSDLKPEFGAGERHVDGSELGVLCLLACMPFAPILPTFRQNKRVSLTLTGYVISLGGGSGSGRSDSSNFSRCSPVHVIGYLARGRRGRR